MPISVLMPARNAQKTIKQAVKSTLDSLPAGAELLVLDDASDDLTVTRLNEIADPRLHIFHNDTQSGVASSLNKLLASSTKSIVARMDADDICLPWRFRATRHHLEKVDFNFSTHLAFGTRPLRVMPSAPIGLNHKAISLSLLIENPLSHITLDARRDSIMSAGGYRNTLAEDYDLWLRTVDHFSFAKRPIPTAMYRIHRGQSTALRAEWRMQALGTDEQRESYFAHSARLGLSDPRWFKDWSAGNPVLEEDLRPLMNLIEEAWIDLPYQSRVNIAGRFERVFKRKLRL